MEGLERVELVSDDSGHKYLIPFSMSWDFYDLLEDSHHSIDKENEFFVKYNKYRLSGCLSQRKIYSNLDEIQ